MLLKLGRNIAPYDIQCSSDISEPKYTRNTRQLNTRIRVCIYANTRMHTGIRKYAYSYTQIRVYSVCAYASLVCMSKPVVSSFVNRSLFLVTEQERVFIILNTCIQYTRVCLQTRLGKMLAETAETNILQLILTD